MKSLLAYLIVIPLAQFCLTVGVMLGIPLNLPFFWLTERSRSVTGGLELIPKFDSEGMA